MATEGDDAPATGAPTPGHAVAEGQEAPGGVIRTRGRRTAVESFVVRLIATAGIVGIGVAIAAIMGSQHSKGWLIGFVVSIVSVALAAMLWSSRRL
jgi:hypothetical protein